MPQMLANVFSKTVIVMLIALTLVACGRRGNLEAPPEASVISVDENGEELEP